MYHLTEFFLLVSGFQTVNSRLSVTQLMQGNHPNSKFKPDTTLAMHKMCLAMTIMMTSLLVSSPRPYSSNLQEALNAILPDYETSLPIKGNT